MDSVIQEIKNFVYLSVFYPGSRQYWFYVLLYVLIGYWILKKREACSSGASWLVNAKKHLFPARIYTHPSFRMDLKFFIVYFCTVRFGAVSIVIGLTSIFSDQLVQQLQPMISAMSGSNTLAQNSTPGIADRILFTIVSVVVLDFGYFLAHFLSHRVPFLWAYHQVHHGAEHLTPLTASRFHPVDYLWTILVSTAGSSLVVSGFTLYHGTEVQLITLLNLSVAFLLFHLLSNFRHSHIWISFGPRISQVLISPCMHQIHHSTERRHLNKNYGLIFSVWDRWFSSVYIPTQPESFEVGLGSDRLRSDQSVFRHLWLPVTDSLNSIARIWRSR